MSFSSTYLGLCFFLPFLLLVSRNCLRTEAVSRRYETHFTSEIAAICDFLQYGDVCRSYDPTPNLPIDPRSAHRRIILTAPDFRCTGRPHARTRPHKLAVVRKSLDTTRGLAVAALTPNCRQSARRRRDAFTRHRSRFTCCVARSSPRRSQITGQVRDHWEANA